MVINFAYRFKYGNLVLLQKEEDLHVLLQPHTAKWGCEQQETPGVSPGSFILTKYVK